MSNPVSSEFQIGDRVVYTEACSCESLIGEERTVSGLKVRAGKAIGCEFTNGQWAEFYSFERISNNTSKPTADGWIPWAGGASPVPPRTRVDVRMRNGDEFFSQECDGCWSHGYGGADIMFYRLAGASELNTQDTGESEAKVSETADQPVESAERRSDGTKYEAVAQASQVAHHFQTPPREPGREPLVSYLPEQKTHWLVWQPNGKGSFDSEAGSNISDNIARSLREQFNPTALFSMTPRPASGTEDR